MGQGGLLLREGVTVTKMYAEAKCNGRHRDVSFKIVTGKPMKIKIVNSAFDTCIILKINT